MSSTLVWNDILGRKIRAGDWQALAEGTPRLISRSIIAEDYQKTSELVEHLLREFRVVFDIYTQWVRDTKGYIKGKGISDEEIEALLDRIRQKLLPYHPLVNDDRDRVWADIEELSKNCCRSESPTATRLGSLDRMVDIWRNLHDGDVDQISGLFHFVQTRFGEKAVKEMYVDAVIGDWFAKRYQLFDVSKMDWQQASWLLTYLGFEGHHGHLSGSYRDGTVDWEEDEEKVSISFAPCGSGGRSMEGESRDNLPPLSEKKIGWDEMKEEHDFTWGKKGICSYCAHCCLLHELLPIQKFGYPVRVTHPPTAPLNQESRCRWDVYKDPRKVPEEVYTRIGEKKPTVDMLLGSEHQADRVAKQ